MFIIRKKLKFEMAHILRSAYSKACTDSIHGHSYVLEVFLRGEELNEDGMLMDFGEIKDKLKDFVEKFDHALLIPEGMPNDAYWTDIINLNGKTIRTTYNPTAEEMAKSFFDGIKIILDEDSHFLYKVRLHETETGYAEWSEETKRKISKALTKTKAKQKERS